MGDRTFRLRLQLSDVLRAAVLRLGGAARPDAQRVIGLAVHANVAGLNGGHRMLPGGLPLL